MNAQLVSIAPQFHSTDFERTATFHAQFGFAEVARYAEGNLMLCRNGIELHFNQWDTDHDATVRAHAADARFIDVAALTAERSGIDLRDNGIPRYVPPTPRPWGLFAAHTADPDGNLVYYGIPDEAAR